MREFQSTTAAAFHHLYAHLSRTELEENIAKNANLVDFFESAGSSSPNTDYKRPCKVMSSMREDVVFCNGGGNVGREE